VSNGFFEDESTTKRNFLPNKLSNSMGCGPAFVA
jgi:hypothetical protein